MSRDNPIDGIRRHYEETFRVHGATGKGVDWGAEEVRYRYRKMLAVLDGDYERPEGTPSLLDAGCGWGGLYAYAREQGVKLEYTGIDTVADMVEHGRKNFPAGTFHAGDLLEMEGRESFDYVVGSGMLALKLEENIPLTERHARQVVRKMFGLCRYGIAVNLMSNRVNFMADNLWYANPVEFLSWCLTEISPRVRLDHGYTCLGRREGRLYEYTVSIYKNKARGERTMKIVISQPMYLPWRGIFEQVRLSDHFVFYDDVQLPKGTHKTFITRVQIKTAGGWAWLSVPVRRSGRSAQLICETLLDGQDWRRRHLLKIEEACREAPFFDEVREALLEPIYAHETENFSDFCVFSTKQICRWLGLRPEFHLSSESGVPRDVGASQRVLELCRRYGADVHVAGHGAKNYMDHELFDRNGIETRYMEYRRTPYQQLHGEFNPHVTILDLLVNVGRDALRYLDSEAVPWQTLPELAGGRETK